MKKQKQTKFQRGDKIRFKSWEELSDQYTVDIDGDIQIGNTYFTKNMKYLCGTSAIVQKVNPDGTIKLKCFDIYSNDGWISERWEFVEGMIEKEGK